MGLQLNAVIAKMAEFETALVEVEAEYDAALAQIATLTEENAQLQEQLADIGTVEQFDAVMTPVRAHIQTLQDKQ